MEKTLSDLRHGWHPPPELSLGTREVGLSGAGVGLAILAVLLIGGAATAQIFLSRLAAREADQAVRLRQSGIETQAVVTRHWSTGDKDNATRIAWEFEYQGRRYHGSTAAPRAVWDSLSVGAPITVRFTPDDPMLNHPIGWERKVVPSWLPGVIAGLLLFLGLFLIFLIRRDTRLLSEGIPTVAQVTGHSHVKDNYQPKYIFQTIDGSVVKGRGGKSRRPPEIGSAICVIYDRERPKRNAPYPLDLARIRT